jgi:hypothetical protein
VKGERPVWVACLSLSLLATGQTVAQTVEVTAYGVAASNSEVERVRQARGLGLGADVRVEFGRFRLEARGLTASLHADFSIQPDYAMHEIEGLATYLWRPLLALQVGVSRRFADPDFAAQEVGLIRVGVLSETRLTSLAQVQARLAYLPLTRFSGGGGSSFAAELGLAVSVGRATGRLRGVIEYTYQRIDREVNGGAAPLTFSVARVGVGTRF